MSSPQRLDSQLYHGLQRGLRVAEMGFVDHCTHKVLVQLFLTGCILSKILLGTTLKRELQRSLQWFLKQGRVLLCSQGIYAQCYGETSQLDSRQRSF